MSDLSISEWLQIGYVSYLWISFYLLFNSEEQRISLRTKWSKLGMQTAKAADWRYRRMAKAASGWLIMRSEREILAEIEKYKERIRQLRTERKPIDAAAAAIIVSALSWAIGDSEDPCRRTKIK